MGAGEPLLSPASHGRALNNDFTGELNRNPNHRQGNKSNLIATVHASKSFNHKTARDVKMQRSISFERAYNATKQGYIG